MRICAVSCVYQQRPLLAASMKHLLLNGIEDFFICDHLSEPPVADWLPAALNGTSARVSIVRKSTPPLHQRAMMALLTETARSEGFDVALAFDADEFWCSSLPGRRVKECIEDDLSSDVTAVRVPFLTYVQHREVTTFTMQSLSSCRYRVVPYDGDDRPQRELVEAGAPFVAMPFESKVIIRLVEGVHYSEGQHQAVSRHGVPTVGESRHIVARHLTIPSRQTLVVKREHGRRRMAAGHHRDIGWQLQRLVGMTDEQLDAYWAGNSWHEEPDGKALVGEYDKVVRDDELVEIGRCIEAAFSADRTAAGASAPGGDAVFRMSSGAVDGLLDELGETLVSEVLLTLSLEEARAAIQAGEATIAGLRATVADLQAETESQSTPHWLSRALVPRFRGGRGS